MFRHAIALGLAMSSLSATVAGAQWMDLYQNQGGWGGGGQLRGSHPYREIKIESNPTGASIFIDGRPFGATPQAIRVDDDRQTIRVILSKPGYLETKGEVDLTRQFAVNVDGVSLTAVPCSAASANGLCYGIRADLIPTY